ncbi:hypothetical protein [Halosegnis longus]|uniref:hypothetical protein n=1 Tax=Halosegnis longus TaxID=2216012 RepID=UPI00129E1DDD|nr:hypothetical protein [Halosegnis longus]
MYRRELLSTVAAGAVATTTGCAALLNREPAFEAVRYSFASEAPFRYSVEHDGQVVDQDTYPRTDGHYPNWTISYDEVPNTLTLFGRHVAGSDLDSIMFEVQGAVTVRDGPENWQRIMKQWGNGDHTVQATLDLTSSELDR